MVERTYRFWSKQFNRWIMGCAIIDNQIWTTSQNHLVENVTDDVIANGYVGREDEDNNKIFEGDILKINGWENCYNVVKWYDEFGGYGLDSSSWRISYKHQPFSDTDKIKVEYKIVGNIYENPELLEGKQ